MEQKITIEKQKEFKNESMFNFKNVSLMKKQLFSLMMAFALVLGLSVSAFAQFGIGTLASPELQFAGSAKTFTVTDAGAASTSWQVYVGSDNTTEATTDDCSPVSATGLSFSTQWTPDASGRYVIQVTETSTNGGCSTIRHFHVLIADFDVHVYACTVDGTPIASDGTLSSCGINASYNPIDNELAGLTGNQNGADGTLNSYEGTDPYNTRYVAVSISSDDVTLSDLDMYWQFDFTIIGDANTDYVETSTRTDGVTVAGENVIVEPNGGSMRTSIVLDLDFFVRWGSDISFAVNIASANTRLSTDGATYNAGNEPSWNYSATPYDDDPYANQSATQTIYGSPATSPISVN